VMCESDDITLEYSWNGDPGEESKCVFWYIKQEEKNMLPDFIKGSSVLTHNTQVLSRSYIIFVPDPVLHGLTSMAVDWKRKGCFKIETLETQTIM